MVAARRVASGAAINKRRLFVDALWHRCRRPSRVEKPDLMRRRPHAIDATTNKLFYTSEPPRRPRPHGPTTGWRLRFFIARVLLPARDEAVLQSVVHRRPIVRVEHADLLEEVGQI